MKESADMLLYLQGFEDDAWGTRRAGGIVIQELIQFILQAPKIGGRTESLCAPILDGAEGFRKTGKLPKALQQQPIHRVRRFIYNKTKIV